MRRIIALLGIAGLLLSGAAAGDYMPDCQPFDNNGRILFAASIRADGALVCRYASPPETPPCPYTSARGAVSMRTNIKPNGVVVCVYGGGN
jgi:hypothetical protein